MEQYGHLMWKDTAELVRMLAAVSNELTYRAMVSDRLSVAELQRVRATARAAAGMSDEALGKKGEAIFNDKPDAEARKAVLAEISDFVKKYEENATQTTAANGGILALRSLFKAMSR